MRTFLLYIFLLLLIVPAIAQTDIYVFNGESLDLRTEVEGPLSLRWNTFANTYRFFADKNGTLAELVNTKGSDGYNEEYITTLEKLTEDENIKASNVRLTLGDLRTFFNTYNAQINPEYVAKKFFSEPQYRLGGFAGISNNIYTSNPTNATSFQLGADFEILDPEKIPRHSAVFQAEHTFSSDEFEYSATQISLNYRFKFIKSENIDIFINSKLLTFTNFNRGDRIELSPADAPILIPGNSGSSLQAPLLFGLGADVKLGRGFLTLGYYDAVGVFIDSNEEFPLDIVLGYKIVL